MSFEKGKSRFLDVSPEVRNIPHLFHAASWSQKKVVLQKRDGDLWLDQPRTSRVNIARLATGKRLWTHFMRSAVQCLQRHDGVHHTDTPRLMENPVYWENQLITLPYFLYFTVLVLEKPHQHSMLYKNLPC